MARVVGQSRPATLRPDHALHRWRLDPNEDAGIDCVAKHTALPGAVAGGSPRRDKVTPRIGVNARLFDDVDAAAARVVVVDGKNLW